VASGEALGVTSSMRVCRKTTDDVTVTGAETCVRGPVRRWARYRLARWYERGFTTGSSAFHSIAWPSTGLGRELDCSATDLLHLHWLGRNTLSVEEVGHLRKPVVWTLHDMWAFCGAEHYSEDERYVDGYAAARPAYEAGPDVNARTWMRKRRAWRRAMRIVCPSRWLAECARRSLLLRDWPVAVIPNPLDLGTFHPMGQAEARARLGLPAGVPVVLFGALGGSTDRRKGADLLLEALGRLRRRADGDGLHGLRLVIFGQSEPATPPDLGFPLHYAGHLQDDISLRLHYAAADVMVVPSRQEAFGQTATESMACGTPVVAFRIGGLPDIVDHERTGFLAEPLDPASLADGIAWVLSDASRRRALGAAAREAAARRWAPEVVAKQYADVYQAAMRR
jgi:glycosyltransferase involved in cell wall biosynthesis